MIETLVEDVTRIAARGDHDDVDPLSRFDYEWDELGGIPVVAPSGVPASAGLAMELEFGVEPLDELSDARLEEVACAYERLAAWAQARQSQVLAQIARRAEADPRRAAYVVDEVATSLHLSGGVAGRRLTQAVALDTHLTATRELWEQGLLCERRVAAIVDGTRDLSDEVAVAVEARVVGRAVEQTSAQLRRAVRRAVLAVDPEGAQERHDKARDARRVDMWPGEDGVATVAATVTAADGVAVYESLTRLARGLGSSDLRGMDARRADLLVGLCTGRIVIGEAAPGEAAPAEAVSAGAGAGVQVVRPVNAAKPLVQVTIDSDTLSHRAQQPGELAGYGPITAQAAREIAADAVWVRLVTNPRSGVLLDRGRDTYRPSAALADFVRARDGSCMFPGCGRSARYCEVDHTRPFPEGPTVQENLYALCVRHHHLKHGGDWAVAALPDGGLEWTSPTGRTIVVRSKGYRPDPPTISDDDPPPF